MDQNLYPHIYFTPTSATRKYILKLSYLTSFYQFLCFSYYPPQNRLNRHCFFISWDHHLNQLPFCKWGYIALYFESASLSLLDSMEVGFFVCFFFFFTHHEIGLLKRYFCKSTHNLCRRTENVKKFLLPPGSVGLTRH